MPIVLSDTAEPEDGESEELQLGFASVASNHGFGSHISSVVVWWERG